MSKIDEALRQAVERLIYCIGEDNNREGLRETPARVARAWTEEWAAGYGQDASDFLKCFEEQDYDEMIVVRDVATFSHCEHHLAPIFGTATIAYVPSGRVLGLSKFARVVDVFARRLQTQERLTVQIADALWGAGQPTGDGVAAMPSLLRPRGVGVMLRCRHLCIESRGVSRQGQETVTTALRGAMLAGEPRAEFLRVCNL